MKKFVFALTTLLFSTQVFAAATLRVPFMLGDDNTGKTIPVAALNAKLAAAGKATLPEFIDISSKENGYNKINAAKAKLASALKSLGEDPEVIRLDGGYYPTSADVNQNITCYKGNALEVADIAQNLTDVLYSEQMVQIAMKYKNKTVGLQEGTELDDGDTQDWLNENSELWKNWSGQGEDLLILSSIGDGGDDVQESLIKRCK